MKSLMSGEESKALRYWAKRVRDKSLRGEGSLACEIGCYHGFSTSILAEYFKTWAIDLGGDLLHGTKHLPSIGTQTYTTFLANMVEMHLIPDRVIPICSTSDCLSVLPSAVFRFGLVDADHSYKWCGRDLSNLERVTTLDGVIAVHDYLPERDTDSEYGVRDAVDEFLKHNTTWKQIAFVGSLIFLSRANYEGSDS